MTTATPRRRGRPGYDQQTVLQRAVELFNDHGYDSTSMGMLADHLGVSKSAIYHHFESKEQLLAMALDRALQALEDSLDEVAHRGGDPLDRLERGIRATILVLLDQLPYVTLLLRLRGNSPVERAALERRRRFDQRLIAVIDEARSSGQLRDDIDAPTTARLIFGSINSTVDWYQPAGRLEADQLADHLVTMLFRGLCAERPALTP